jgi:hydroxymethylglutaryl-CoA lyase
LVLARGQVHENDFRFYRSHYRSGNARRVCKMKRPCSLLRRALELAKRIAKAGAREIEMGAFVSPQWVPQMAGSDQLIASGSSNFVSRKGSEFQTRSIFSACSKFSRPRGRDLASGVERIAIFASASESFLAERILIVRLRTVLFATEDVVKVAKSHGT